MKAVKIIVGTLASAYTVMGLLQLAGKFGAEGPLSALIVPPAIGAAVALAAFTSAFKTEEEPGSGAPPPAPPED